MPDASITLHQVRESTSEGLKVTNEIILATVITDKLFVMEAETDEFSHVATLEDLSYPDTPTEHIVYYLSNNFEYLTNVPAAAIDLAASVKDRLNTLLLAFNRVQNDFVGSEDTIIPTPVP